jgi:magnesium chelatase subunit D
MRNGFFSATAACVVAALSSSNNLSYFNVDGAAFASTASYARGQQGNGNNAKEQQQQQDAARTPSIHHDCGFIKQEYDLRRPHQDQPSSTPPSFALNYAGTSSLPFGLIVDQEGAKQALILAASHPQEVGCKGVVLLGGKGTCKSILARSAQQLLPPTIQRVKGSSYNIDPNANIISGASVDTILQHHLRETNKSIRDLETEAIPTPFITVPINCQEDSLLGSVDLEQSMMNGVTVFEPGLLARAHRGLLFLDDTNLMEEELVTILLNAVADGYVTVEREGTSMRYPCQPQLVVACFNPAEGTVRPQLLDRFAMCIPTDRIVMSTQERVQAALNVECFQDKTMDLTKALREEQDLRGTISAARIMLPKVQLTRDQLLYICEEATRADCEGQRAELFAAAIAKTSAALDGRTKVSPEDLQRGVLLAIAPRSRVVFAEECEESERDVDETESGAGNKPPQPPQAQELHPPTPDTSPPPNAGEQQDDASQEQEQQEHTDEEDGTDDSTHDAQGEQQADVPQKFMFGVDAVPLSPTMLKLQSSIMKTHKGKGGKGGSTLFNLQRGRFVKAIFPKGGKIDWKRSRIAIGATLRASAPYQKSRRKHAALKFEEDKKRTGGMMNNTLRKVFIRESDIRIKRLSRKAGSLVIFVVDGSGSMALNRMGAAKGAAISLLEEAYKNRDQVCLMEFHDQRAQVLVPPTKSTALAKRRLETMPCGGKSPLAHALATAIRTGLNAIKVKQNVGRVVVVLFTDGRANVPLSVSEGDTAVDKSSNIPSPSVRAIMQEEVLALAKQIGVLPKFDFLCIDTEDKYVGTGIAKELARVAQGNYYHMEHTDARDVTRITQEALEQARLK